MYRIYTVSIHVHAVQLQKDTPTTFGHLFLLVETLHVGNVHAYYELSGPSQLCCYSMNSHVCIQLTITYEHKPWFLRCLTYGTLLLTKIQSLNVPRSLMPNHRSSLLGHHSSIHVPWSSVIVPQSTFRRSSVIDPRSSFLLLRAINVLLNVAHAQTEVCTHACTVANGRT